MSTPSPRVPLPDVVASKATLRIGEYEVILRENGELTIEYWEQQYTGELKSPRFTQEETQQLYEFLRSATA
jgi:hypothetical protein